MALLFNLQSNGGSVFLKMFLILTKSEARVHIHCSY